MRFQLLRTHMMISPQTSQALIFFSDAKDMLRTKSCSLLYLHELRLISSLVPTSNQWTRLQVSTRMSCLLLLTNNLSSPAWAELRSRSKSNSSASYTMLTKIQYERFWMRPFDASVMWLGLLYAVLAIGARFQTGKPGQGNPNGNQNETLQTARMDFYRERVVQALVLANYTKCPPYTVETMLLYFGTEYSRSPDTQFSMWVFIGMVVRIALRMGYHREPSRFSNISVFRAELRRRTWLVILSVDLVSSAQVGLPRMIQPFMYDAQEPRNLKEEELFEEMTELPPSRPETELTPLLYMIVMTRVRTTHAKILDLTNATSQPPYREIMNVDALLRHVYDKLPESSKAMPAADFDTATTTASLRRLYLGLSFLKAELMLHRPYLLLGRTDNRYDYSRRVCLNAASEMLVFQQKLDAELKPGGKLWAPGWKIFTMSW